MNMRLTWPNRITLTRTAAVPLFVIIVLNIREGAVYRYLALGVFLAIALLDLVDGWLARRLGQQTRLGAALDPLADKLLLSVAFVILAIPQVVEPPIPLWVVVVVVSRDVFLVVGSLLVHLLSGRLHVRATRIGRVCTFAQASTVMVALSIGLLPPAVRDTWGWWALRLLAYAVVVLTVVSGFQYGWRTRAQLGAAVERIANHDRE